MSSARTPAVGWALPELTTMMVGGTAHTFAISIPTRPVYRETADARGSCIFFERKKDQMACDMVKVKHRLTERNLDDARVQAHPFTPPEL
jgi:hypothetical protein